MRNRDNQEMGVLELVLCYYEKCQKYFSGTDVELDNFLKELIDIKTKQIALLKKICSSNDKYSQVTPQITIDDVVKDEVKIYLQTNIVKFETSDFTKDDLMKSIVKTETSFWNEIFLYTICLHGDLVADFDALSMIKRLELEIRNYVKSLPYYSKYLEEIKELPEIWKDKILIVDDEEMNRNLFSKIFEDKFGVTTAESGEEALLLIKNNYFDFVITDICMTGMSGIELYNLAVKIKPDLPQKIIFITGCCSAEEEAFIKKIGARFLLKPVSIVKLKKAVEIIIQTT